MLAGTPSPLPLPASGHTLDRWRALARLAGADLAEAKIIESHHDAVAILAELGVADAPSGLGATWCAEPPGSQVLARAGQPNSPAVVLHGTKRWCSAAARVDWGVMSVRDDAGLTRLAIVGMDQPEHLAICGDGWHAVGMRNTETAAIELDGAAATLVGAPGQYVERPGFWQGAIGVAACWHGASVAIGDYVRRNVAENNAHAHAHLGAIDAALHAAAAQLREAATWVDANPVADAMPVALRTRLSVERAAIEVLERTGRALGAGPLCNDAWLARVMADLPVYLRQSHAERDMATLGAQVRILESAPWSL